MADCDPKKLYNEFMREQLQAGDIPVYALLRLTPSWPGKSLFGGAMDVQTAMSFIHHTLTAVDPAERAKIYFYLHTLCEDPPAVLESMRRNGFELGICPLIFEQLGKNKLQHGDLAEAFETFVVDKEPWMRSFIATVCQDGLSNYIDGVVLQGENRILQVDLVNSYVALVMALLPASEHIDETIDAVSAFDLKGPQITSQGNIGELLGPAVLLHLLEDAHQQYVKMIKFIASNRATSAYAELLWRPFYRFDATAELYALIEKVSDMTVCVDLEDPDREDMCVICCDAVCNVSLDPCKHTLCAQCVYTLMCGPKTPCCPFCRADITDVSEFEPKSNRVDLDL